MRGLIGGHAHASNLLGKMNQALIKSSTGYPLGVGSGLIKVGLLNILTVSPGRLALGITLLLHHANGYDGGLIKNNYGNREANLAYYIGGRDYGSANER